MPTLDRESLMSLGPTMHHDGHSTDLDRLREEYAEREKRPELTTRYSLFNLANLFLIQARQRATVQLLRRNGIESLAELRVLEVGCGAGGVLLEYLAYGVPPDRLFGIDILQDRLVTAKRRVGGAQIVCGDAQTLPFLPNSFDVVLIYTAMSSILDNGVRARFASEVRRVGKAGTGFLLWYDFWVNPGNKAVRGVSMRELKKLFAGCTFDWRQITLAPPLARRLVPISWIAAATLEALRLFNTHYLVLVRLPPTQNASLGMSRAASRSEPILVNR
jgi:ubiquinone/menaquinone biosynthesis C-methylase UbiE